MIDQNQNTEFEGLMIQGCFKLPVKTQSEFSLTSQNMQIHVLPGFTYEGKEMYLRYELSMIVTSDREAGEKCQVDVDLERQGSKWTKVIDHAEKIK